MTSLAVNIPPLIKPIDRQSTLSIVKCPNSDFLADMHHKNASIPQERIYPTQWTTVQVIKFMLSTKHR